MVRNLARVTFDENGMPIGASRVLDRTGTRIPHSTKKAERQASRQNILENLFRRIPSNNFIEIKLDANNARTFSETQLLGLQEGLKLGDSLKKLNLNLNPDRAKLNEFLEAFLAVLPPRIYEALLRTIGELNNQAARGGHHKRPDLKDVRAAILKFFEPILEAHGKYIASDTNATSLIEKYSKQAISQLGRKISEMRKAKKNGTYHKDQPISIGQLLQAKGFLAESASKAIKRISREQGITTKV